MQNITYAVYIKTDERNRITAVNSSAFLTDASGWTQIDEGTGDRYRHAQGNYFDKPIYAMDGILRYRLDSGMPIERADAEMDADRAMMPQAPPSETELLRAENMMLTAQMNALIEQNDFYEELIVELANEIYA